MAEAAALTASDIIAMLGLERHPEGGWYRETFRDAPGPDGRARSTAIYFLLEAGEVSAWHRVDAAEVWHWYAGAPLALGIARDGGERLDIMLGPGLTAGHRPQAVVPPQAWQRARSLGAYTLVGCTVAPGFVFEQFQLAPAGFEPGASV